MKIIANIIDIIPESNFTNEKKYNFLQTKFSLLDLILDDLRRYMGKCVLIKYAIKHSIPIKENCNLNTNSNLTLLNNPEIFMNTYEGFYNHRTNIELRLNFIKYIFPLLKEFSDKDLSFQLEKLWDIFFDLEFYKALISNSLQGSNKQNFKIDICRTNTDPILMEIEETSILQLDLFSKNVCSEFGLKLLKFVSENRDKLLKFRSKAHRCIATPKLLYQLLQYMYYQ